MSRQDKLLTAIVLFILVLGIAFAGIYRFDHTGKLTYNQHLEETVLTVDGKELTLGDLASYIAYEERLVEEQARVYDYENPQAYWNVYLNNGGFVKLLAKQAVIDMAVHDEIFYQMAIQENVALDEEERAELSLTQEDFWLDLSEEQQERLGVSREQLDAQLEKKAVAEKYQEIYAASQNSDYDGYNTGERPYENLVEQHSYQIEESLWERIDFGNITLSH
ncbi:MAG: hypothetical protein ACI4DO_07270 [Roseburia sp.]